MANFKDYIKNMELFDAPSEGDGTIAIVPIVSAFGLDGQYGKANIPIQVDSAGESEIRGICEIQIEVNGKSGTFGEAEIPVNLTAQGYQNYTVEAIIPFQLDSDAEITWKQACYITFELEAIANANKVYQLCENENWGL